MVYTLYSLIILIISFNLIATQNSSCPGNLNSVCTALPFNVSNPPDVWLNVPDLSVQEISLVVQDIQAHVSLSAEVANLVAINAGVDVSIATVNLTITGVRAQVQLAVYLDKIAAIITRTMASLDLNPLLTSVVDGVFDIIDNLLLTFTKDGKPINQIVDKLGNIINQVLGSDGSVLSSDIVGNYLQNMTYTGISQTLANGDIIKQYSYPPPPGASRSDNILVNIVFDSQGNPLSATVVNPAKTTTTTTTTTNTQTSSAATIVTTTAPRPPVTSTAPPSITTTATPVVQTTTTTVAV